MKRIKIQDLFDDTDSDQDACMRMEKDEIREVAEVAYKNAEDYTQLISSFVDPGNKKMEFEPK